MKKLKMLFVITCVLPACHSPNQIEQEFLKLPGLSASSLIQKNSNSLKDVTRPYKSGYLSLPPAVPRYENLKSLVQSENLVELQNGSLISDVRCESLTFLSAEITSRNSIVLKLRYFPTCKVSFGQFICKVKTLMPVQVSLEYPLS